MPVEFSRAYSVIIDASAGRVWEAITNSKNFKLMGRGPWWWSDIDRATAKAGTIFKKGRFALVPEDFRSEDYYIVNWQPERWFSMGYEPDHWEFSFRIFAKGQGQVRLQCTRRFRGAVLFPGPQNRVEYAANAVKGICEGPLRETSSEVGCQQS